MIGTLIALCTLFVLGVAGLGVFFSQNEPLRGASATVDRLEIPTAGAPKLVAAPVSAPEEEDTESADVESEEPSEVSAADEDEVKVDEGAADNNSADRVEAEGGEPAVTTPSDPTLYLTVPKLGLYDNVVRNDTSDWALDQGAVKVPQTGFPSQDGANTYIAGHRIGYEGTESYQQFYNLPSMQMGDEVTLTDANGTSYTYRVNDMFAVMPQDTWVTEPVPGEDTVTLQTCVASLDDWQTITPGLLTSPPGPETARLIVRAEKVDA